MKKLLRIGTRVRIKLPFIGSGSLGNPYKLAILIEDQLHEESIFAVTVVETGQVRFVHRSAIEVICKKNQPPRNEAFDKAIAAEPSDAALRLVYADWLEEHGNLLFANIMRDRARQLEIRLVK